MAETVIFETENFTVCVSGAPHIPREEGGHMWVRAKNRQISCTGELSPKEATEAVRLVMLTGEAMIAGMKKRGVEIIRINYQENGNWAYKAGKKPVFHVHLYARTENQKTQTWPEALYLPAKETGYYDGFERLNEQDIQEILSEMRRLEDTDKYKLSSWGL